MTEQTQDIHAAIEAARAEARAICTAKGDDSPECAAAWDVVEELQATASHQQVNAKTPFQRYCEENPEADECRLYDD